MRAAPPREQSVARPVIDFLPKAQPAAQTSCLREIVRVQNLSSFEMQGPEPSLLVYRMRLSFKPIFCQRTLQVYGVRRHPLSHEFTFILCTGQPTPAV
jgi:hypothetical protein